MKKARPSALAVLTLARKLLARGGLCHGAAARDRFGNLVGWHDHAAVSFCPVGATYRAAMELEGPRAIPATDPKRIAADPREAALARLDLHLPAFARRRGMSIVAFADTNHRSTRQVLEVFDRAIRESQPVKGRNDAA